MRGASRLLPGKVLGRDVVREPERTVRLMELQALVMRLPGLYDNKSRFPPPAQPLGSAP